MAKTQKKTLVLAIRPCAGEFHVLEDVFDPTAETIPRILGLFDY